MYTRAVREYVKFLGGRFATQSNHLDVQEFLAEQAAKGILPRTVLYKLYSVRVFFDFLSLGGLINWSPPRIVHMRRVERRVPPVLTVKQVRRLFRAVRTIHERALLEVLYGTGCRTGEVRTMLIEDIDFVRRRIRVRGKVGTRFVMFSKHVGTALRRYMCSLRGSRCNPFAQCLAGDRARGAVVGRSTTRRVRRSGLETVICGLAGE
jgi:integrase/recombinase XerD